MHKLSKRRLVGFPALAVGLVALVVVAIPVSADEPDHHENPGSEIGLGHCVDSPGHTEEHGQGQAPTSNPGQGGENNQAGDHGVGPCQETGPNAEDPQGAEDPQDENDSESDQQGDSSDEGAEDEESSGSAFVDDGVDPDTNEALAGSSGETAVLGIQVESGSEDTGSSGDTEVGQLEVLPFTGSESTTLALLGLAVLMAGGLLLFATREDGAVFAQSNA